jgi:hypothetical protein
MISVKAKKDVNIEPLTNIKNIIALAVVVMKQ